MLQQILEHAERQGWQSEPGFSPKFVKWAINCNSNGEFTNIIPLGTDGKGMTFAQCPDLTQGEMIAGGITRSQFLVESLQTLLKIVPKDPKDIDKYSNKHQYQIKILRDASTAFPSLDIAANFLANQEQQDLAKACIENISPKPKPIDNAVIVVEDINPLKSSAWHDWWREYRLNKKVVVKVDAVENNIASTLFGELLPADKKETNTIKNMVCLLTGEHSQPALTHNKITGLSSVGGQSTGSVVAGFDKAAFQSYGLDQSYNAATSAITAKKYAAALNKLLAENSETLVGVKAVYWFKEAIPAEDDPFTVLIEGEIPGEEHAPRQLLRALRDGQRPDLARNEYYNLTLSGAAARVMVRGWQEGRYEHLITQVAQWFEQLAIVRREGNEITSPPKFFSVLASLERDVKDLPPNLLNQIWWAATTGSPLPYVVLQKALQRVVIALLKDENPRYESLSLLKLFHLRNKGDVNMQPFLNQEHPSAAYQSGRLLAVIARLQYAALGDVGAGVVQRYYGAASQTPALTIGRLMNNAKNHLGKLDGGLAFWFEGQISEVMGKLQNAIPRSLTLEEQSLFALGYYQQLAVFRASKNEKTPPAETT